MPLIAARAARLVLALALLNLGLVTAVFAVATPATETWRSRDAQATAPPSATPVATLPGATVIPLPTPGGVDVTGSALPTENATPSPKTRRSTSSAVPAPATDTEPSP